MSGLPNTFSYTQKAPCKDCKERCVEPNCHTYCKKYLDWSAEHNRCKSLQQAEKDLAFNLHRTHMYERWKGDYY